MESAAVLTPSSTSLNCLLLSTESKLFQKKLNMKIQHFISVRSGGGGGGGGGGGLTQYKDS